VSDRMRVTWYGIAIFLSSAFLLVLEILAGRLIAPYVGVSLYTWTAIIGVILAGLSLGNWLGGVWADRGGTELAAGITLALAGLFSLGILFLLTLVAPLIEAREMTLLGASFFYVLALFFTPAVLLGVVTPLLTTLALALDGRTGHIVGRMHALAALGSILGTFITGYFLVQYLGTRGIIIGTALGLFLLALPFFRRRSPVAPIAIIAAAVGLVLATDARNGFSNPCDSESNYFCIRIVDASDQVPFGTARSLILDHLVHGTNHQSEPGLLISPYVQLIDELALDHFGEEKAETLRWFFAGGGAYTLPRSVQARTPGAAVTVAELDPMVTRSAEENLFLRTDGMRVVHDDARIVLKREPSRLYDVIVADAFHDISIPYHLVTQEYAELVKSRLAPDGIYLLNVLDAFPDPRLVKSMMKTLAESFEHVHVWMDMVPPEAERMTFVLSASDVREPPETLVARRGLDHRWLRATEPMMRTGTPFDRLPLLTDDYVPVERLVSEFYFRDLGR
jgi:predicted membrane-bound spermidine synthase